MHCSIGLVTAGNTNRGGRLITVDLLIKVACFLNIVYNIFNTKRSLPKLVSTMRSTVLSLSLQQDFPGHRHGINQGAEKLVGGTLKVVRAEFST